MSPVSHSPNTVEADGLHVAYGTHEALRSVSFKTAAGSFVAVLGPNGSGKTSLIKALVGIVPSTGGTIRVLGRAPRDVEPGEIGYVPQVKTLERRFPATAVELVVSGLRGRWPFRISQHDRDEAAQGLERVGARHLVGRQLASLSGGELQRVYLARSLIRRPQLVLLDEPATGIDVSGTTDLYDVLEAYQRDRGATIFMVTHDLNAAFHHASHVLLLNREQISYGSSERVLTEENLRRAFGHVGHEHGMFKSEPGHA